MDLKSEKRYSIVDSSDNVLFGFSELSSDHPAILRIVPYVSLEKIEIGRTVAGVDICREEIFVKRIS